MTTINLIEIFCILDEFCKYFSPELNTHIKGICQAASQPSERISDSEVMTILVLFHTRRFRDLKSFYLGYVCQHMTKEFPHTYRLVQPLCGASGSGRASFLAVSATGIFIMDSTPLVSCHIKRMHMHRTMRGGLPRASAP